MWQIELSTKCRRPSAGDVDKGKGREVGKALSPQCDKVEPPIQNLYRKRPAPQDFESSSQGMIAAKRVRGNVDKPEEREEIETLRGQVKMLRETLDRFLDNDKN
jgi:hypothetical protein